MNPVISIAAPRDAELLGALGRETYAAYFGDIWTPAALARHLDEQFSPEMLRAELSGRGVRYYLVTAEGGAIGFAKLNLSRPLPVPPGDTGAEIQKIYFRPGHTGRGHGAALLQRLVGDARAAGFPLVWLDVLKSNAGARRAYERQGFAVVGELPFATEIRDIGFWEMARREPPADD